MLIGMTVAQKNTYFTIYSCLLFTSYLVFTQVKIKLIVGLLQSTNHIT